MIVYPINIPLHIQRRGLLQVNSIDKNSPTGLFSSSIFGLTQDERKTQGAYISLNCSIVRPGVLEILKRISRTIYRCATEKNVFFFSRELGVVDKEKYLASGNIIPDDAVEGYGPMFLYEIWDKIDKKSFEMEFGSHINKEMKSALGKKTKDDIFISYQYVMAIAFREEPEEDSVILQNEINQMYANIIKYSNILENNTLGIDTSDIHVIIQKACSELYNHLADRYTGPKGVFRKGLMSRTVANACRLTIVASNYKSSVLGKTKYDVTSIGIPLHHTVNMYRDFFIKHSKDFLMYMYEQGVLGDVDVGMLDSYDTEYWNHLMSDLEVQHTRVQPFQVIQNDGTYKPLILPFEVDLQENGQYVLETKPLSNMEFFYIVATEFIKIHETKAAAATRYPTDSALSTQMLKPVPTTLFNRYLKPTKVLGMEFDEYYPYVSEEVSSKYYLNIFEQGCRLAQAVVVGYNGDFDGDSVSIKPIISDEAVKNAKDIQNNLLFCFDYTGNFRRGIGKDGAQTMFSLSREPNEKEKPKTIDSKHDFVLYIMNTKNIDLQVIYSYLASFKVDKKPELNIYDKVTVTINKKKIDTTIGRLILNMVFFKDVINHPQFDFINEVMYENIFIRGLRNVLFLQAEGKVPVGTMNNVVSMYNEFVLRASTVFNASCTYEMLNPDKEFVEFRNNTINPIADEVKETGDIEKLEGKENDVINFAKKKFKNDDMYELYISKNKAKWDNDFKAMHINMGALPSLTGGKAAIITRPLTDGMTIEDMPALVNTGAMGAYARGCQTALGGALYKQITNAFGNIKGVRGDCGNNKTIDVYIEDKFDSALGCYMVDKSGKNIQLTLDNIDKYVGKTVSIRDPFFCTHGKDSYCSHCVGETPFYIMNKDIIPLGVLTAEAATGVLNMFMKATHDLKQSVFIIDDMNKFILPKADLFEIKVDPVDKKKKVFVKERLIWRVPALSVETVDSEYSVMAHGSILETKDGQSYTMILGTEVTTTPTSIIDVNSKENEFYKHFQFIYEPGDALFNDVTFYKKENTVYKMINLFLSGNVSNLIPVRYHLETLLNTFKTNKKITASLLTYNILLSTLARDYGDLTKPVRETQNSSYIMVSTIDLIDILGGTFEAIFSGDVNRGLFITTSKSDKEQTKVTSDVEKAFYY